MMTPNLIYLPTAIPVQGVPAADRLRARSMTAGITNNNTYEEDILWILTYFTQLCTYNGCFRVCSMSAAAIINIIIISNLPHEPSLQTAFDDEKTREEGTKTHSAAQCAFF